MRCPISRQTHIQAPQIALFVRIGHLVSLVQIVHLTNEIECDAVQCDAM